MDAAANFASNTATSSSSSWSLTSMSSSATNIFGLSFFASLLQNHVWMDSLKLLVLGTIIETGRRLCQWLIERFSLQLCVTARFDEGDPTYEWIILFLTQEKIWRRTKDFAVASKSSKRKWGVDPESEMGGGKGNADYIPTYQLAQLFRWNGYWVEVKRTSSTSINSASGRASTSSNTIYISMYTLRMSALTELVEEARSRYMDASRPNVTVHMADSPSYGPDMIWTNVKQKSRRPMNSVILPDGVVDSLVQDAQEFIDTEDWYVEAGIPHRRGYLLHGPPGTGKTSTIYALAGELGLEIYTLSLSSTFIDDTFLTKAASSIPKKSIFLIEDIDCAFPAPRDDDDDEQDHFGFGMPRKMIRKSSVTLSGLLNVLDGVGSEEGKLFFATTNHPDRLDPALTRPGRIDMKVEYFLATQDQASALFLRFFNRTGAVTPSSSSSPKEKEKSPEPLDVPALSHTFASHIPEHQFSTAELQGYLLTCKRQPLDAVNRIKAWVEQEFTERAEKERKREEKNRKKEEEKNGGAAASPRPAYGVNPYGMVMPGYAGGMVKPVEPTTPVPAYSAPASGGSSPAVKPKDVKEEGEEKKEADGVDAAPVQVVA